MIVKDCTGPILAALPQLCHREREAIGADDRVGLLAGANLLPFIERIHRRCRRCPRAKASRKAGFDATVTRFEARALARLANTQFA